MHVSLSGSETSLSNSDCMANGTSNVACNTVRRSEKNGICGMIRSFCGVPSASDPPAPTIEMRQTIERILTARGSLHCAHYLVLGIPRNATQCDIKKAYRKLSIKVHPDKNSAPNAAEAFRVVRLAYETLLDPRKRARCDQLNRSPNPKRRCGEHPVHPDDASEETQQGCNSDLQKQKRKRGMCLFSYFTRKMREDTEIIKLDGNVSKRYGYKADTSGCYIVKYGCMEFTVNDAIDARMLAIQLVKLFTKPTGCQIKCSNPACQFIARSKQELIAHCHFMKADENGVLHCRDTTTPPHPNNRYFPAEPLPFYVSSQVITMLGRSRRFSKGPQDLLDPMALPVPRHAVGMVPNINEEFAYEEKILDDSTFLRFCTAKETFLRVPTTTSCEQTLTKRRDDAVRKDLPFSLIMPWLKPTEDWPKTAMEDWECKNDAE